MTPQELYNERLQLIQDTIALKPTKRMVNAVRVNYWPYLEYGMTLADAMRDYKRGNECFYRFHREFAPDVASTCSANYPSKVYEITGLKTVRWPGDPKGLDVYLARGEEVWRRRREFFDDCERRRGVRTDK